MLRSLVPPLLPVAVFLIAGSPFAASRPMAADEIEAQLRREIGSLEALSRNELPDGAPVQSLFEVDLRNETDVALRVAALRRAVAAAAADLAAMEPATSPPRGDEVEGSNDGAGGSRRAAAGSEPSERGDRRLAPRGLADAGRSPGGAAVAGSDGDDAVPAGDGGPGAVAAPAAAPVETIGEARLRLRRDRLRQAFLERPEVERRRLLAADAQRSRVEAAEASAKRGRQEARLDELAAERARNDAIERAGQSADTGLRVLSSERARVEATRATLAALRGDLAGEQAQYAADARTDLVENERLARRVGDPALDAASADRLYPEIVGRLGERRSSMRAALSRTGDASRVVPFRPGVDLSDGAFSAPALAAERRQLEAALAGLSSTEADLLRHESEARWSQVSDLARDVLGLNELRIQLLPRLSPAKRRAVLGFGATGMAQLGREIDQLDLMVRYHLFSRGRQVVELREGGLRSLTGALAADLGKIVALILVAIWLRRRQAAYLSRLGTSLRRRIANPNLRIFAARWLRFFAAVAPEAVFLCAVYAVFAAVGYAGTPELVFLRTLLLSYIWYRVLLALVHNLFANSAATGLLEIPAGLSTKILKSVRLVGRFLLTVVIFLTIARRLVGRGYLYGLVVDFFWVGAVPIGFVLIKRWRDDIAEAYLTLYPEGRLADAVRRHRKRRSAFFVTAAAFFYVTTRGVLRWAAGLLLRFRRARQAIAFLFNRGSQTTIGLGEMPAQPALPQALVDALTEDVAPVALTIDHFPHLDEVASELAAWRAGGPAPAVALVGDRGTGKSTWLAELGRRQPSEELVSAVFHDRILTERELVQFLARALGVEGVTSSDELVANLRAGPPRVITLDLCQNLVLRAAGGLEAFTALATLTGRTLGRVAWVCAFARYAWEHARSVAPAADGFDIRQLGPWSEEDVHALLKRRLEVAGVRAVLDDSAVDPLAAVQRDDRVLPVGSDALVRSLIDRSDGIPRIALNFWGRSLFGSTPGTVTVRLGPVPTADALEALPERTRFVLAAVLTHENLTLPDVVRVCQFSFAASDIALESLRLGRVLELDGPRYRVSPFWNRAVVRYLRRKHLVHS